MHIVRKLYRYLFMYNGEFVDDAMLGNFVYKNKSLVIIFFALIPFILAGILYLI